MMPLVVGADESILNTGSQRSQPLSTFSTASVERKILVFNSLQQFSTVYNSFSQNPSIFTTGLLAGVFLTTPVPMKNEGRLRKMLI